VKLDLVDSGDKLPEVVQDLRESPTLAAERRLWGLLQLIDRPSITASSDCRRRLPINVTRTGNISTATNLLIHACDGKLLHRRYPITATNEGGTNVVLNGD
jgi:hypothetical protein